jgi:hypothetical protein
VEQQRLRGLRGERAVNYDVFDKMASGKIDLKELTGNPEFQLPNIPPKALPAFREDQAIALALFNRTVEIAKKPLPDQPALWQRWEADIKAVPTADRDRHALVYLLMPVIPSLSQAYMRTRAILRATETTVGLERVRRAKGRWPKPGDPLAPAFKDTAPADPFTGKPILWKPAPGGLVVYSVGYDRADNNGKLENARVQTPGTDIGFRIPDAERRPRPARTR